MRTAKKTLKTGDKVIYVAGPDVCPGFEIVGRVTKSGQFYLASDVEELVRFRLSSGPGLEAYERCDRKTNELVYPYYDETYDELMAAYRRGRSRKENEVEAKRIRLARQEKEFANRLAEFQTVVGGWSGLMSRTNVVLYPNEVRRYSIIMPIHPHMLKTKGTWEELYVVCRDVPHDVFTQESMVEESHTFFNGGSFNFPSCSTTRHRDNIDALWAVCVERYFSW